MIELIEFDRDRPPFQHLDALFERRLGIEAGGVGQILPDRGLDEEMVLHRDDREKFLAVRGGARHGRRRGDANVRAAADDGVGRAHPGDERAFDLEPVLLPKVQIVGKILQREAEAEGRDRQAHVTERFLGRRRSRQKSGERRQEAGPGTRTNRATH